MAAKTRFAIVGAGVIGQIHATAIHAFPDAEVTWVVDVNLERAEQVSRPFGARATSLPEEAIGAPDVDAVLVAVPTHLHRHFVELAAAHGKHVLCEKPIASSVDDAGAMIAACERAGVRLMVGQVVRHFPEYARAKEILDTGTLGPIGTVRASRAGSSPVATRKWLIDPNSGGGVVLDLMIHELDLLQWYFGELSRAYAFALGPSQGAGPVEYAQALLRFTGGVVAHVEASWAHHAFRTRLEIAGQHGLLSHDSQEALPIRLEVASNQSEPGRVEFRASRPERPYATQLRHFVDRLHSGEPFLVDGAAGVRALEAALAVSASARTGKPVRFEEGRPMLEEPAS
jgi:predicted dehydrogenase